MNKASPHILPAIHKKKKFFRYDRLREKMNKERRQLLNALKYNIMHSRRTVEGTIEAIFEYTLNQQWMTPSSHHYRHGFGRREIWHHAYA